MSRASEYLRVIASILCLLVSVLFGIAGTYSYYTPIGIIGLTSDTSLTLNRSVLTIRHIYKLEPGIPVDQWPGQPLPQQRITPPPPSFPWIGFSSGHQLGRMISPSMIIPANYWRLYFTVWPPVLIMLGWSLWVLNAWIRSRHKPGTCPACNYDLRGSKGSATCPECGEAIKEKVADEGGG